MNNKTRVLITDDNRHFCTILKEIIEKDGNYDVVGVAHDGVSALELIHIQSPDMVILDIIMPMLDGLGVLEKCRNMDSNKKPKFIVMSAVGHDDITFRAINLGASYYVVKPFDMVEFMRRLKQFAAGKEPEPAHYKRSNTEPMEDLVSSELRDFGVPMHIKGYQYIMDSVLIVLRDPATLGKVTKAIYPPIAQLRETTPSRVERSIRNAIDLTLARGNQLSLRKLFKLDEQPDRKIANSEFIAMIAEKIRLDMK
jgi:two-component system response regulator (stage 0 sporulation protein A)